MTNAVAVGNVIEHPAVTGAFNVAAHKGTQKHAVSSQWYSRPDDQRFLSLGDLHDHCLGEAIGSYSRVIDSRDVRVLAGQAESGTPELQFLLPGGQGQEESLVTPNHWSFGQTASLVKAPAGYLRSLPPQIAGINLQYGLSNQRSNAVKAYANRDGECELRAVTGPDYGRIFDHEVVAAVQKIAGNGTGDTRWKIPGVLEGFGKYNPFVDITKQNTTLFASDRDVFMFLVDDTHPIEIGKLENGDPDLVFRGFYVWNSEVGSKTFGVAAFYLRGVCQNRILWGVENFQEISFRHSKAAPERFMQEVYPALESFADRDDSRLIFGVQQAKQKVVAGNDDERDEFLKKRGFSKAQADAIIESVVNEEGKKPESIWDFVQGITAVARTRTHQDSRIDLERAAGKLLDKVA